MARHPVPKVWVPRVGSELWDVFWSVSPHRTEQGRIPPGVVADWCRLHGKRLDRQEIKALEAMDAKFSATLSEEFRLNRERQNRVSKGKGTR